MRGGISKSPAIARVVTLIFFYSLNFWPNLINDIFLESGKRDLAIGAKSKLKRDDLITSMKKSQHLRPASN